MFNVESGLSSLLSQPEILIMILRELKVVGAAIAGFTKVQQQIG
jgi:hypothetical protein